MDKIQANPFQCGGAIRDPQKFVGRDTEFREILSRVATMQSVSVCGPRRIGKSSLLRHIADTGRQRLDNTYEFHYEDMQPLTSPEEFYSRVCNSLGDENGEDYDDLRALIDGRKIVLCLDEFEKTVEADFGADFFDKLRSLAQTGNLALILATKVPLDEIYRRYQGPTSGFPNIFTKVMVREMASEEARRLVSQSDYFDQKEQDFILDLAGGHPYWLNFVCAKLYDAKQQARSGGGNVNLRDIERLFKSEFDIAANGKSAASDQRRSVAAPRQAPERNSAAIITSLALALAGLLFGRLSVNNYDQTGLLVSAALIVIGFGLFLIRGVNWLGGTR